MTDDIAAHAEASATPPAVVARGLYRRFGAIVVLRGLELEIEAGINIAVFGPNGSGKTTLLRIIAGLLRADDGRLEVLGHAVPGDIDLRRRLGVVGHEPFLYADLSAEENLSYYARLYGVSGPGVAAQLLERVGLTAVAGRRVRGFSRGMMQRLAVARALLHDPDLLLLDEPYTGLDPDGCEVVESVLRELKARGKTVIVTTHDFERGIRMADRVVLLHGGEVVWSAAGELPTVAQMTNLYARFVHAEPGRQVSR